MVAIVALPLLHVPPDVRSVNVVITPWQIIFVPVMATGVVFTVNESVDLHDPIVYEIVVLPADIALNIPVPAPIVALAVALLVHVPPATVLASVAVVPVQAEIGPVIAAGAVFTVIALVA
jgi:hypothetical protein